MIPISNPVFLTSHPLHSSSFVEAWQSPSGFLGCHAHFHAVIFVQTLSFLALFPQVPVDFLAWNPSGMGQVVFSLYNSEAFRKINQPKENKICHSGGKSVPLVTPRCL